MTHKVGKAHQNVLKICTQKEKKIQKIFDLKGKDRPSFKKEKSACKTLASELATFNLQSSCLYKSLATEPAADCAEREDEVRATTAEKQTVCAHKRSASALFLCQFLSFWET